MDYNVNATLTFGLRSRESRVIIIRVNTGKREVFDRISTNLKLPKGAELNHDSCTDSRFLEARQVAGKYKGLRSKIESELRGKDISTKEKLKAITAKFKNKKLAQPVHYDASSLIAPGQITLKKALEDYLKGISNGTIKTRKMTRFAEDTVRSYTLKIQNFLDYLEETGQDQPISNFDLSSTQLSAEKVEIRDRYNDLFEGFYEHLKDRDLKRRLAPSDTGLAVNSIAAIINKVKTGLTNRFDEYCYVQPKLKFSIPEEDSDTIVLPV